MAEAGTDADKAASKKRNKLIYPIDLGSSRTGAVIIRGDIAEYFNFPEAPTTLALATKVVNRKTTGRELFVDLQDVTGTASESETNNKYLSVPALQTAKTGKNIVVPTELKTSKGTIRKVTIKFPHNAINAAISKFLYTNCKLHVPRIFYTPAGVPRFVMNVVGELNPSEDATPTAA